MQTASNPNRLRTQHALVLLIPALLFGFLVAAQWQTQQTRSQLVVRYNTPLAEAAHSLQTEQDGLKAELSELRARLDDLQSGTLAQSGVAQELQDTIEQMRRDAGIAALGGDGVTISLDDSKNASVAQKDLDRSICHATDLTDIVNTAWRGGSQGIAINNERLVGTSSVYCVGSTIMVNGTLMSPPFNITAVGPQDRLLAAFDDPNSLRDIKQRRDVQGLGFRVTRSGALSLPAYDGPLTVRYATTN